MKLMSVCNSARLCSVRTCVCVCMCACVLARVRRPRRATPTLHVEQPLDGNSGQFPVTQLASDLLHLRTGQKRRHVASPRYSESGRERPAHILDSGI